MEMVIAGLAGKPSLFDHFLLKDAEVVINYTDAKNTGSSIKPPRVAGAYRWTVPADTVTFDLIIQANYRYNGVAYPLLKIIQSFSVAGGANMTVTPWRWQKLHPTQASGLNKTVPAVHPLLQISGGTISVDVDFVDISTLFDSIHGATPWFATLDLIKGTARTILVLASLRGHPFIWYVIIPASAVAQQALQPNVLIYPADYGGISYVADKIDGITTANHNTSVGNIQCGGETLFSFLTRPLTDDDYADKLKAYVTLSTRFKKRTGRNPPSFHHFREVLSYNPDGGTLTPRYWDIPFGFEVALDKKKQILLIPQVNGGDASIAIKAGLKQVLNRALSQIYCQGNTLTYDSLTVNPPVLICYSQSGGNIFTACRNNMSDIKGIICFEPQYMNAYLTGEDKNLALGMTVIPLLLRAGGKVVIVGRHKDGWEGKYLPNKVALTDLNLLPDDAHYEMLRYPNPSKPYDPAAFPVLARRYSRLLKGGSDPVIKYLAGDGGDIDADSALTEAKVDDLIATLRKTATSDEKLVKAVFTGGFDTDTSGGYYTHNLIVSSGQDIITDAQGAVSVFGFFQKALDLIG